MKIGLIGMGIAGTAVCAWPCDTVRAWLERAWEAPGLARGLN